MKIEPKRMSAEELHQLLSQIRYGHEQQASAKMSAAEDAYKALLAHVAALEGENEELVRAIRQVDEISSSVTIETNPELFEDDVIAWFSDKEEDQSPLTRIRSISSQALAAIERVKGGG